MPQDLLQIAIEHHRAGRVLQAEQGYRAVLSEDASNADALNWLGILLAQAGQPAEALPLFEKAAALRPADAAIQHNLGFAAIAAFRFDQAVASLRSATSLAPHRTDTRELLARALVGRRKPGDVSNAVQILRSAIETVGESSPARIELGLALLADKRFDEAIVEFQNASRLDPDSALPHCHLAAVHRMQTGDIRLARKHLNRAIDADPNASFAWLSLAVLEMEAGSTDIAIPLLRKAIKADPKNTEAYRRLASAYRALGRRAEAEAVAEEQTSAANRPASVEQLELRLKLDPETAQLHEALSAMTNLPGPARVPSAAVAELFDRYADAFDEHLRERLECRVPEQIAELLSAIQPAGFADTFDLGCGTGLCAPLLRPMTKSLAGIDLSAGMIAKARDRGGYDRLEVGDLVTALARSASAYDLLVAADVLIYIGDLAPTFEAAFGALRAGGLFAFSVEAGSTDRFELNRKTRRYAHGEAYLWHLSRIYGFVEVAFKSIVVRMEAGNPVAGFLVVVRKS